MASVVRGIFSPPICQFDSCGLQFASNYDLYQHIEETHTRKDDNLEPTSQAAVSCTAPLFLRLPETRAKAVKQETVHFYPRNPTPHYGQANQQIHGQYLQQQQAQQQKTTVYNGASTTNEQQNMSALINAIRNQPTHLVSQKSQQMPQNSSQSYQAQRYDPTEISGRPPPHQEDLAMFSDDQASTPDTIHRCQYCNKTYKAAAGLRYHTKNMHPFDKNAAPPPAGIKPKNFKCTYCAKAYKTQSGLNHHLSSMHTMQTSTQLISTNGNVSIGNIPSSPTATGTISHHPGGITTHSANSLGQTQSSQSITVAGPNQTIVQQSASNTLAAKLVANSSVPQAQKLYSQKFQHDSTSQQGYIHPNTTIHSADTNKLIQRKQQISRQQQGMYHVQQSATHDQLPTKRPTIAGQQRQFANVVRQHPYQQQGNSATAVVQRVLQQAPTSQTISHTPSASTPATQQPQMEQ